MCFTFCKKMAYVTKLDIILEVDSATESISDVVSVLPSYSASSFVQLPDGRWHGDFTISCSVAPELAEGDFIDDFAPYFRTLLELRTFHSAKYEFHIAVGSPAAETFDLDASSVALIAALGAPIKVRKNPAEQAAS
jgi:hypothetical protein